MRLTWFALVSDRRPMLAGLVLGVAMLGMSSLCFGQAAPAQQAAPAAEKKAVSFQNDVGVVLIYVKADKTADFEELITKLKDGLAKTEIADIKQLAPSLKFLKAPNGPAPAGNALYVMLADPVVKDAEYWFLSLLYKLYPADAQALYAKWTETKGTIAPMPIDLSVFLKMQ